jgi:hypothetical protein
MVCYLGLPNGGSARPRERVKFDKALRHLQNSFGVKRSFDFA